jgi:SnoaL-like domain
VSRNQPVDSRRTVWNDICVIDAITRYERASEANDIDGLMATLAPDAELVSPVSGRMVFRGADDLRVLLTAVYGSITGLHWHTEVGDGNTRVIVGEGKLGGFSLGDAMVLELGDDGRIRQIRPHLRPWLALTVLAIMLGPKVGRHPGVVLRAMRPA